MRASAPSEGGGKPLKDYFMLEAIAVCYDGPYMDPNINYVNLVRANNNGN